jgi:sugar phosphate isomerase/epimerase
MPIRVGLSSSSVYPDNAATAFATAGRLGYDAVEIMVWTDPVTQEAGALRALSELHELPIVSVHAPTLLLTQRVWGTDPWGKVDRSVDLALEVGASTVVLHPPFRWQKEYAGEFVEGVARRERDSGVRLAVENMYPWRTGRREVLAYRPHWDPTTQPYDSVTIDLSHTATAGSDAVEMVRALGPRLAHLHLTDGDGSFLDEHLVPGRGTQPCTQVLEVLSDTGWSGDVVVEVSTRKVSRDQRDVDLAESLAFARFGLLPTQGASRI